MPNAMARRLRRDATEAEKVLWRVLRNRSLGDAKFRRQVPIGRYIVDFACLERGPVIEADGGQHAASENDAERTNWLESRCFRVLRFWNHDILENPEGIAAVILEALAEPRPTPPSPSRSRGALPLPAKAGRGPG